MEAEKVHQEKVARTIPSKSRMAAVHYNLLITVW